MPITQDALKTSA